MVLVLFIRPGCCLIGRQRSLDHQSRDPGIDTGRLRRGSRFRGAAPTATTGAQAGFNPPAARELQSRFGGRTNDAQEMPTLERLAKNGLTYTQWHTVALCSPTRSCFLTGRNLHQNGYALLSEVATGFPGHS